MMSQNFIYRGFNSNFDQQETGIPATKEDVALIEESIRQILLTHPGERVFHSDFGAGILQILFEHDRRTIESELRNEILQSIKKWEPRAVVESKDVTIEFNDDNEVIVSISFNTLQDEGLVSLTLPLGGG